MFRTYRFEQYGRTEEKSRDPVIVKGFGRRNAANDGPEPNSTNAAQAMNAH
jgi:hypothetical protein